MNKKAYMTPVVEVIEVMADQLLMTSGVSSELGIGYGGVDEGGTLDPAAPPGLPDMGELDFIFK